MPLQAQVNHVSSFGNAIDPEDFEFADIRDIATYGSQVFVLDNVLNQVHQLKVDGNEIIRSGALEISQGRGPGELVDLTALAVSESYIVIGDGRHQKIVIFDHQGELVHEFNINFRLTRIHLTPDEKNIVVSGFWLSFQGEIVHVYDLEGNQIKRMVSKPDNWIEIAQTGNFERILLFDNSFYISYPFPYQMEKYSYSGELIRRHINEELTEEIIDDNRLMRIDTRIVDLQNFQNHIIVLVQTEDSYILNVYDRELNQVNSIKGEQFNLGHISYLRVVKDQYLVVRQLEWTPHLLLFKLEI